ncbi:MAG: polysaccharide deacetylase family protein [Armatimonadetes bacterium]|nr:polysaccharide deacetylase family protein [Armatimonadota bacterium]
MENLSSSPVKARRRFRLPVWIWLIGLAMIVGYGWWWNVHRSIPLSEAISPVYWYKRFLGEDLYDPHYRILYHGNRALHEVALTIDDGPHPQYCPSLLAILRHYHVHATFFVVGQRMKQCPYLVQDMLADGNEVGNHTVDHIRLVTLNNEEIWHEINDNDINFFRITGHHMTVMRPPGVDYNPRVLKITKELGYVVVSWTCAARDYDEETPDFIVNRILDRTENGSIILLHDDRPETVVALPRIISALLRQGYHFVTIAQMLAHLPHPVIIQPN